jgi:NADH-quinone oxidoreductase subunit N
MSAPLLWIILPAALAIPSLLIYNRRILAIFGGGLAVLLGVIALVVPIDQAIQVGSFSIKIAPDMDILGRRLILTTADGSLLVILYGLVAMWLFGGEVTGTAYPLTPIGLMVMALLVASIAVEPFLYAAILIEIAVLLSIPLLLPLNQTPGPGVMRFLVYQTLGMPFILFAGWLLAGVESSPGDLALAIQSATILGLGFAFLLAMFPLYVWLPMLAEEASPYVLGFLFWVMPTITIIFGMSFLDRYSWLRTSAQLSQVLSLGGLLMVVTGGLWSAFQRHLGRQMAYAVIAETGFSLLAFSLSADKAVDAVFLLIIPRSLALLVWAMSLDGTEKSRLSLCASAPCREWPANTRLQLPG